MIPETPADFTDRFETNPLYTKFKRRVAEITNNFKRDFESQFDLKVIGPIGILTKKDNSRGAELIEELVATLKTMSVLEANVTAFRIFLTLSSPFQDLFGRMLSGAMLNDMFFADERN